MSITLSAPLAPVQDVRMYAEKHATSMNAIIREHLEFMAAKEKKARRQEADKLLDFFMGEEGWFDSKVKFDRNLANAR